MHERSKIETTRSEDPHAFRVDGCLVSPSLNRIEREGEVISIEPRVMQVLVRLAEVPGRVLTRQALFESVWADSLVCEEALTRIITELRRVFRDDRRQPRVIETIRKGGYRLIAPVAPAEPAVEAERESEPPAQFQVVEQEMGAPTPAEAVGREPLPEPKRGRGLGRAARAAGIALVSLGFLTAVVWNTRHPDEPPRAVVQLLDVVPITSFPGLELFPDLSPNGAMLAFSWSGEGPTDIGALDLYVMQLPSGRPTRLVDGPGSVTYPSGRPTEPRSRSRCRRRPEAPSRASRC
ncbi:MAG: winged helix-turn-helix domain-containing protein [Candidatus Eisenbacteria bacterium]|nr:winged helix-turn-helix domain-containing protein [Candidatus Eisenbacteria bacterium]